MEANEFVWALADHLQDLRAFPVRSDDVQHPDAQNSLKVEAI